MEATSTGIVRQSNSADTGTRIVNRKNKKTLFNFTFFVYKIVMARPLRSSYVCTPPRRPRIKATRGEPHASVQAISIALRIGMEETLNKKIPDARVRKKPFGGLLAGLLLLPICGCDFTGPKGFLLAYGYQGRTRFWHWGPEGPGHSCMTMHGKRGNCPKRWCGGLVVW